VSITAGASGIGDGTVTYRVAENKTGKARDADITVAGKKFQVSQKKN
jgi:hypothetical protein